jgi:hypothetical protein
MLSAAAALVLTVSAPARPPPPRSHYVFKGAGIEGVLHVARSQRRLIDYFIVFVEAPCPGTAWTALD